jgi:hypothetical protein
MQRIRHETLTSAFRNAHGKEQAVVTIDCRFASIDLTFCQATLHCAAGFWGSFSKPPTYTRLNMPAGSTLVVQYNHFSSSVFQDGNISKAETIVVPLGDDNSMEEGTAMYPDTKLSWELLLTAYTHRDSSVDDTIQLVPIIVSVQAQYIPMFQINNMSCKWSSDNSALNITGQITIDSTSYHLLIGMQGAMWAMAGSVFVVTVSWAIASPMIPASDVKYDLLGFSAALLFALPAMRSMWPVAPPSGTMSDVMHIYAQLLLVSFAIILQLGKFFFMLFVPQCSSTADSNSLNICSKCSQIVASKTYHATSSQLTVV